MSILDDIRRIESCDAKQSEERLLQILNRIEDLLISKPLLSTDYANGVRDALLVLRVALDVHR